jgi:hypothetical protein
VQVVAVMCLQVAMAYYVADMPWWKVLLAAYVVSGTASQNLFTAQHELSHYLAFRTPLYNRILSLASNCPLVVPTATAFRKYHQEHHSHLVRARLPSAPHYPAVLSACCAWVSDLECRALHCATLGTCHNDLKSRAGHLLMRPWQKAACPCCAEAVAGGASECMCARLGGGVTAGMRAQGVDGWDVDLPTFLEANYITSTLAKVLWVFVYIAVYGLRPIIIRPKPIGAPAGAHLAFLPSCSPQCASAVEEGSWSTSGPHAGSSCRDLPSTTSGRAFCAHARGLCKECLHVLLVIGKLSC